MPAPRVVLLWVLLALLGLPALLLSLVRGVDLDADWALRALAFVPLALASYAVLLVVALLALLGRRSRARAGVAALALAGLLLHFWWFSPQLVGDAPQAAAGAEPVTMMSANVLRGGADAVELVRAALDEDVDVLVVSEITPAFLADLDRAGLGELLPERAGSADPGVAGTMVFAREEVEVVEELDTLFDSLVVSVGGLTVIGTHPAPPTLPDDWRRDHGLLLAAVERLDPDVVLGDLNATVDHLPLRDLADAGLRDSAELANAGLAPTWPTEGFPVLSLLPPVVPIDHVLVRDTLAVLDTGTLDLPGTDHRLVVASLAPAVS